jgi:Putative peptidoglycan binding domain
MAAAALCAVPATASARPHLTSIRCYRSCVGKTVTQGGRVEIRGSGMGSGTRAVFPIGGKKTRSAKGVWLGKGRLKARVPGNARSGGVYVVTKSGQKSNSVKLKVARSSGGSSPPPPTPTGTAFDGSGMWIWHVSNSDGGSVPAMINRAQSHGVTTLFIKSSDGTRFWSQFSPALVAALHAGGLRVCGWQYVYGNSPTGEADLGALAKSNGADCLVIDAESQYEGKYGSARTYVSRLRSKVGDAYPVGLAGFPYVDYHPAFPYSVFLGPRGAQFNVPQVYWKEIGGGVDAVMNHTYRFNRPYGRPIAPLGQLYHSPSRSDILRFRQIAAAQGASGLSWWDWEEASSASWNAIGAQLGPFSGPAPATDYATLGTGGRGDLILWAQQHLRAAGESVPTDGKYGSSTTSAVRHFQSSHGLSVNGKVDTPTWKALLGYSLHAAGTAHAASVGSTPPTAKLPARRDEIPSANRR